MSEQPSFDGHPHKAIDHYLSCLATWIVAIVKNDDDTLQRREDVEATLDLLNSVVDSMMTDLGRSDPEDLDNPALSKDEKVFLRNLHATLLYRVRFFLDSWFAS